jgi:CelD/BcsL family acetyltransferase involved in cellulose biosynthesis
MVRRRRKQLAARPGGHRYLSGPTLEPALLERVARLHSQRQARLRQQGRERISLFDDPVQARGFGELLTWAAAEGATWHHWLEVDGKLAGALLSFRQGRTLFPYLIAIDEEFGELSPSLLLHMQLVEQAHEQGQIRLIDQLPGENQLKRQISTRMRPHHRYSIPNSARTGAQVRLGYYRLAKDLLGRFRS